MPTYSEILGALEYVQRIEPAMLQDIAYNLNIDTWCYYYAQAFGTPCPDPDAFGASDRMKGYTPEQFAALASQFGTEYPAPDAGGQFEPGVQPGIYIPVLEYPDFREIVERHVGQAGEVRPSVVPLPQVSGDGSSIGGPDFSVTGGPATGGGTPTAPNAGGVSVPAYAPSGASSVIPGVNDQILILVVIGLLAVYVART